MRTADRPLPASITLDAGALATWPVRPVIAIEQRPVAPYVWDDGTVWDAAGAVWDAANAMPAFVDATCDFTGCDIEFDGPDDQLNFPAGHLTLTLDNRSGRWARYNVDGTPTDYGVGQQVWVWADEKAGPGAWWLFAGRIARWDERADDTIEIEAFDFLTDLAQPVGTFTPGAAAEQPGARLTAISALAAVVLLRTRYAAGTVALTRQATERAPLEEMQTVAGSDGGVLYGDADGTVVYADRTWRVGRSDQPAVPVVGTNVCAAPLVLHDPVLSTTDTALATTVVLENVAGLKATATKGTGPYVLAAQDQQWTTQPEGDTLAAALVAQTWQPRLGIDTADVYLMDPAQPAALGAVDWRRGDRIRVLHDSKTPTGVARVDIEALIVSLAHAFTPDGWVLTFGTGRALAYYTPAVWDSGAVWDAAGQVWGY